ncbi:MAG: hypothetical protein J5846_00875, partial [Desulfovibrio sp.]|nr:hypothetical protein [Desulfovibrio sp.]
MGKRAVVSTLHVSRKLSLVFLLFISLFFCRGALAAQILPSDLHGECIPFLPYLEYTLDEKGSLDIEALALQEKSLTFQAIRSLGFAPEAGTFWLRFTIGPLAEGAKPMEWLLSLGESLPGDPKLYIPEIQPQTGMQQWRIVQITDRHILNLPEAGSESKTCFIRLDGPPGLWFAPMLRSPHNAANNWGALARPAAVLILAILLLLSLLRCFSEKGQWRLWTVLFVGCALAAGYLGLPTLEKGHIGFGQFAKVLAPGLALMLLPHVARHMMRTQHFSRFIDAQLIVLTLVGACVTLVPLVPGFSWTARFLELWPLVTIFFIPTALWALFLGIPTAMHFLLICLLPPLFTAAGLLGLLSGLSADILAAFPLFGIVCSSLLLVASHSPENASKKENNSKGNETIMLKDQLDDPNLRIIAFDQPQATEKAQVTPKTPETRSPDHKVNPELLENLQRPVDLLLSEATHLEECALPPAVRVHAKNMVDQAKRLWNLVKGNKEIDNASVQEENGSCDLQIMMRDIYNHAMHVSNTQEIALGWYMPPEMPSLFQGKVRKLKQTLEMLVESSVRATPHGSVHFTVCPFPESDDTGHLLFSVTDTGSGMPPRDRSGLALTMAWELVADLQGALTLQSSIQGTTINLAVHLTNLQEKASELCKSPLILICSQRNQMCEQIQTVLQGLPCRTRTCASLDEALAICPDDPFVLLIAHEAAASAHAAPLIATIRQKNLQAGLPFCKILAITRNDLSWKELGEAGYTLALLEPLDEEALRVTVTEVIEELSQESNCSAETSAQKGIPDLFGNGGAVPKDIEQLTGLAKLINTFSTLGKQDSKNTTLQPAEHGSQTQDALEHDLLSPTSAPLSFDSADTSPSKEKASSLKTEDRPATKTVDSANTINDTPGRPLSIIEPEERKKSAELQNTKTCADISFTDASETAQDHALASESAVLPSSEPSTSDSTQSPERTVSSDADREQSQKLELRSELPETASAEPVKNISVGSETSTITISAADNPPAHELSSATENKMAQAPLSANDEWVGEPTPVAKPVETSSKPEMPSKDLDSQKRSQSFLPADEWVGEPTPVAKPAESSSKPEMPSKDLDSQKRSDSFLHADEWVGEPTPVAKPAESSSKPEMPSKDLDSQKRSDSFLHADEWVGEPT